jgi:shikimate kinase
MHWLWTFWIGMDEGIKSAIISAAVAACMSIGGSFIMVRENLAVLEERVAAVEMQAKKTEDWREMQIRLEERLRSMQSQLQEIQKTLDDKQDRR